MCVCRNVNVHIEYIAQCFVLLFAHTLTQSEGCCVLGVLFLIHIDI